MNYTNNMEYDQNRCKHGSGPSSFWMHDPEVIFNELNLRKGDSFLDLGCGPGDYAIRASGIVGNIGAVYALDKRQYLVAGLIERAGSQGIENLKAMVCDITGPLSIDTGCIDVCLLSTVLHIFNLSKIEKNAVQRNQTCFKTGRTRCNYRVQERGAALWSAKTYQIVST